MSLRAIRGPLKYNWYKLVTTGNYTVVAEAAVVVNKTVGAATTITLPPSQAAGSPLREVIVQDAKGDAGTNNITIVPAGSDTINGGSSYAIAANYGRVSIMDCGGGNWVVTQGASGTIPSLTATTLTAGNATINSNLTVGGSTIVTQIVSYNAAGTVIGNATAVNSAVNLVAGANNAAGVQLPQGTKGQELTIYSNVSGKYLLVYPPVNGAINNASANAAFNANTAQTPYYATCIDTAGNWVIK